MSKPKYEYCLRHPKEKTVPNRSICRICLNEEYRKRYHDKKFGIEKKVYNPLNKIVKAARAIMKSPKFDIRPLTAKEKLTAGSCPVHGQKFLVKENVGSVYCGALTPGEITEKCFWHVRGKFNNNKERK
jgi:hypothetical protein